MIVEDISYGHVINPEAVQKWGDVEDWTHAVGTGPFILTDYVTASSLTAVRNPNYWGYDELYPENRLPYVDKVKVLIIPDDTTAIAALRTGKIELIEDVSWEQAARIKQTNPELKQESRPQTGDAIVMMLDKEPFTDIKVRKAMQMAIDLDTIAATYYGGMVDGTPYGLLGPAHKGICTPFEELPQEVKEGYTYNPTGAKALLAEAGYPDGFKTSIVVSSSDDLDLFQILKAYLMDIGVDMEIQVMEPTVKSSYTRASQHEMCSGVGTCSTYPPINALNQRYSGHPRAYSIGHCKDAYYDELHSKAKATLDEAEFIRLVNEADNYAIAHHWIINILPKVSFCIYQPWLNRYQGEIPWFFGQSAARYWIDKDLRESMGF
jgi:peptide/nickel transport system substrate-binding protein